MRLRDPLPELAGATEWLNSSPIKKKMIYLETNQHLFIFGL